MYRSITASIRPLYAMVEDDVRKFVSWVWRGRKENGVDASVLSYPRTCMMTAKSGDETLLMIPLQPVLFFESMSRKEDLSDREVAICMWRIGQLQEQVAKDLGYGEGYFTTTDAGVAEITSRHGWEQVMYDADKKMFLMKKKFQLPKEN